MQAKFDDLWERYELLLSGQELFGMKKSEFPSLMEKKKEFNLLQKLYGLYNQVNRVIDGYYNKIWTDVDIEKINDELSDFQNKLVGFLVVILYRIYLELFNLTISWSQEVSFWEPENVGTCFDFSLIGLPRCVLRKFALVFLIPKLKCTKICVE